MKKVRVYLLLFVALLALGGAVWAFWASGLTVGDGDGTITINVGTAEPVATEIRVEDASGNNLVPILKSTLSPAGSVEYVVIPVALTWVEDIIGANWEITGTFSITGSVFYNGEQQSYYELIRWMLIDAEGLADLIDGIEFDGINEDHADHKYAEIFDGLGDDEYLVGSKSDAGHVDLVLNGDTVTLYLVVFICQPTSLAQSLDLQGTSFDIELVLTFVEACHCLETLIPIT